MDQTNLLESVKNNDKSRPKRKDGKDEKQNTFDSVSALYEGRELTRDAFRSGIFPINWKQEKQGKESKILTLKQMLQILPKLTKWNQKNYIFFISRKINYYKSIQQYNEFNKLIKQNEYYIYEFWE